MQLPKSIHPEWLAGFAEGEGCFFIAIQKSSAYKLGKTVSLIFQITQHVRDRELLYLFIKYLGCGRLQTSGIQTVFLVTRFEDISNIIVPFFNKYSLQGDKKANFLYFCEAVKLVEQKAHLTQEGLDKIIEIKLGMNRGR